MTSPHRYIPESCRKLRRQVHSRYRVRNEKRMLARIAVHPKAQEISPAPTPFGAWRAGGSLEMLLCKRGFFASEDCACSMSVCLRTNDHDIAAQLHTRILSEASQAGTADTEFETSS